MALISKTGRRGLSTLDRYIVRPDHPVIRRCNAFLPLHPDNPFLNGVGREMLDSGAMGNTVHAVRNTTSVNTPYPNVPLKAGELGSTQFNGAKLTLDSVTAPLVLFSTYPWRSTLGGWFRLHTPNGSNPSTNYLHGLIGGDCLYPADPWAGSGPRITAYSGTIRVTSQTTMWTGNYAELSAGWQVGQWFHVVAMYACVHHSVRYPDMKVYYNGKLIYDTTNNSGLGTDHTINDFGVSIGSISNHNINQGVWYEATMRGEARDCFYSPYELTAAEVEWLYEQPDDFYFRETPRSYFFGGECSSSVIISGAWKVA